MLDYEKLMETALRAVLGGAKIAENAIDTRVINSKGNLRDVVTQTDLDISDLLTAQLSTTHIPVLSEEGELSEKITSESFWAVDPIDGTANFSNGLPQFAISAGLIDKGDFSLGLVCAPKLGELYFTLNREKSLLNGRPFSHEHRSMNDALIAASFSAKSATPHYDMFRSVNQSSRGCLRTGSAALNICWCAAGKLQGAYGFQAKLWDVAGSLAIARAAGCRIALNFKPNSLILDYIVGSHEVVDSLAELAAEHELCVEM